jgi:hypothetical protein
MDSIRSARLSAAAIAALSLNATAATLPFSTSFEATEGYANGSQLSTVADWTGEGQDSSGWLITNQTVGGSAASAGSQWVLVNAPTATVSRFQWTSTPVTDFSVNSTVVGSADVKLVSPATGTVNRSTVAGVQMYDADINLLAQLAIVYDAQNAYGYGVNATVLQFVFGDNTGYTYDLGTTNPFNQYVNLALAIDFTTDTVKGYFNGVEIAETGSAGGATNFHDFDLFTARLLTTTGGTAARAGFDNYNISLIPTPGSIALMGLGGLVVARRRR